MPATSSGGHAVAHAPEHALLVRESALNRYRVPPAESTRIRPRWLFATRTVEVSVSVANNVVGSGQKAGVTLDLKTSKHLQIVGPAQAKLTIDELREGTATFKLKATSELGSGSLTFTASPIPVFMP